MLARTDQLRAWQRGFDTPLPVSGSGQRPPDFPVVTSNDKSKSAFGRTCLWTYVNRGTRHGMHDLCLAFLTAVDHVVDLAARDEDAHFHERSASGALRRMGLKARLGFL